MDETKKSEDREKMLAQVTQELKNLDELEEMESLIQNNSIEFSYQGQAFRVRKPTRLEKLEVRSAKNKKQNELLRDSSNVTEVELIDTLLKRQIPVNIPQMRHEVHTLQQKIEEMAVRLTECQLPNDRKKIIEQIQGLRYEQLTLQLRISDLLSCCVEKQLRDFLREFLVYVVLETKSEDKWVKYFKSYDQFMASNSDFDDKLIYRAAHYLAILLKDE